MGNCSLAKVLGFAIPSLKKAADNAGDVLNEAVLTWVCVCVFVSFCKLCFRIGVKSKL